MFGMGCWGHGHGEGDGRRRFARHGWGWGGGWGQGMRMRAGRMFEQGDLRLVVLALIADKPRHGYEVIKAIEERFGGGYSPSPGAIYPTLTLLEELGHVAITPAEGGKKLHTITPEGQAWLEANRAQADAIFQRMDEAGRAWGGGAPAEVQRAMHNLRLALSIRLRRGGLTPEETRRLAELIDRAAAEIERG